MTILTVAPLLRRADAAPPEDADRAAMREKIERLIDRLDAETRRERILAERELLELGPQILPLLPPPELLPNVSSREAVRRIRISLERQKAAESVRAAQVSLEGRYSLAEALRAVGRQTGNRIDASRLPETLRQKALDVDCAEQPFWQVMDDLAARAGFAYDEAAPAGVVALRPLREGETREANVAYSGAFRISVASVGVRELPGGSGRRLLRVNYRVRAEPRLRPLFARYHGADFRLQTGSGRPLTPFSPDARPEIPLGEGGRHLRLHADFKLPESVAPASVRFQGRMTVTTAADSETIAFDRLSQAEGASRRRGGVTVKLLKVDFPKQGGADRQARFRVAVAYDFGGPAFESHRLWMFHNRVYLETEDGRRIERDGAYRTTLQTDGAVAVEYGFRKVSGDPDDYRFVYVAPTLIIDVPVDFNVSEIPVSPEKQFQNPR